MIYYCDADLRVINGGAKVFIEHVHLLNKYGVEAKLVCSHPISWWFQDVESIRVARQEFLEHVDRKRDIIVFTGPWAYPWTTLLSDNCVYIIQGFRDKVFYPRDPYYAQDQMIMKNKVIHKIAVSSSISEYHYETNGITIPVMPNGIMLGQYLYDSEKKLNRIFCHARKGTETAQAFRDRFYSHALSRRLELCYVEQGTLLSLHETIRKYRHAKYVLDFSPLDGFALMPLEAMATGCIVFCLNNGGNREYLQNGVNGFSYEADQPYLIPEILNRMEQLERDNGLYDKVYQNALTTARAFDWDKKIIPYLEFYNKLQ